MSDSGRLLVPFSSQAINVLSPQFGAKGDGVTDDTTAVQGAVNAASARASLNGICDVWLPSGYGFKLSQVEAKAGVRLWCYGATVIPNLSGINQGLLHWGNASSLSRFAVRGGLWQGTGTEGSGANLQMLFEVDSNGACNDCLFADMDINNWGTCVYYVRNGLRVDVIHNNLQTIGGGGANNYNAVNFVVDGTFIQGSILRALHNTVQGVQAAAVAYVNPNGSGPADAAVIFAHNITRGIAGGSIVSGGIMAETSTGSGVVNGCNISDNDINNPATTANSQGILLGGGASFNIAQAVIAKNRIVMATTGTSIGVQTNNCADSETINNRISGANTPVTGQGWRSGNRYTTNGILSGTATLVAGSATVNTTEAGDQIWISRRIAGGTIGELSISAISAGTSFTVVSTSGTDTSSFYWKIDH